MTFWDFLSTPLGAELVHGAILLINLAVLMAVQRTNSHSRAIEKRLDHYVGQLMRQIHGGHEHT